MGLNLNVPLPGPVSYNVPVFGRGRGSQTFVTSMALWALVICVAAVFWWLALAFLIGWPIAMLILKTERGRRWNDSLLARRDARRNFQ